MFIKIHEALSSIMRSVLSTTLADECEPSKPQPGRLVLDSPTQRDEWLK